MISMMLLARIILETKHIENKLLENGYVKLSSFVLRKNMERKRSNKFDFPGQESEPLVSEQFEF